MQHLIWGQKLQVGPNLVFFLFFFLKSSLGILPVDTVTIGHIDSSESIYLFILDIEVVGLG